MMEIIQLPVLSDNYIYIVTCEETGMTGVVDPASADPVIAYLLAKNKKLDCIFNTHHHEDHTGGNARLLERYPDCEIVAPASETARIPDIDIPVKDGSTVRLGMCTAKVMEVPGHTTGHVIYWFEKQNALFCGDSLFSLGCGRMFEGTPAQMWDSLKKIRSLPDETHVYCAHEYTLDNAKFAETVEANNPLLKTYRKKIEKMRAKHEPTVPSVLAIEKAINPFLRCDHPEVKKAVGLENSDPSDVFAEVRRRKDNFRG